MRQELMSKRAGEIRAMFGRIAHRYDLLNRLLSVGQDERWRRLVAQRLAASRPGLVVDVCTGTGDVALALADRMPTVASDFCLPMLVRARQKGKERKRTLPVFAADALRLPLADGCADAVTVAFGIRNFEDLDVGLQELVRVLCAGGRLLILEFSRPRGWWTAPLRWWVRHVPPRVGRVVSGDGEAYSYLPQSVSTFPDGEELCVRLERLGLDPVRARPLTAGVATLYEGLKPAQPSGERTEHEQ